MTRRLILSALLWAVTWKEWDVCKEWSGFGPSDRACQVDRVEFLEKLVDARGLAETLNGRSPRTSDVKIYEMREIR